MKGMLIYDDSRFHPATIATWKLAFPPPPTTKKSFFLEKQRRVTPHIILF